MPVQPDPEPTEDISTFLYRYPNGQSCRFHRPPYAISNWLQDKLALVYEWIPDRPLKRKRETA
jgi:hypothetical protein